MAKGQKITKDIKKTLISPFKEYWGKHNFLFLFLSLLILVIGYFLMSQGPWDSFVSLTLSPIILTIVYLVLIPVAILVKKSSTQTKQ